MRSGKWRRKKKERKNEKNAKNERGRERGTCPEEEARPTPARH